MFDHGCLCTMTLVHHRPWPASMIFKQCLSWSNMVCRKKPDARVLFIAGFHVTSLFCKPKNTNYPSSENRSDLNLDDFPYIINIYINQSSITPQILGSIGHLPKIKISLTATPGGHKPQK